MIRPEISSSTIVLRGSFNPAIFQPSWFVRQSLLAASEAEFAEGVGKEGPDLVIAKQVSQFQTENYIIQVTPDRFVAGTKPDAHWASLKDLVLGTFYVLEHTPVVALGLNRQLHYSMPDQDSWHNLGDRLAPKDGWRQILAGRPGMVTVDIEAEARDREGTKIRVKVQPSLRVKPGVYFETNEHYPAQEPDKLSKLLETLRDRWEDSQKYAEEVANHIIDWASR